MGEMSPEDRRTAQVEGGKASQLPERLAARIARAFYQGELSAEQVRVIQTTLRDLMAHK